MTSSGATRAGGKPRLLRGPSEADTPPHSQLRGRRLMPLGSWPVLFQEAALVRPAPGTSSDHPREAGSASWVQLRPAFLPLLSYSLTLSRPLLPSGRPAGPLGRDQPAPSYTDPAATWGTLLPKGLFARTFGKSQGTSILRRL